MIEFKILKKWLKWALNDFSDLSLYNASFTY
jgi:hypothetical protein